MFATWAHWLHVLEAGDIPTKSVFEGDITAVVPREIAFNALRSIVPHWTQRRIDFYFSIKRFNDGTPKRWIDILGVVDVALGFEKGTLCGHDAVGMLDIKPDYKLEVDGALHILYGVCDDLMFDVEVVQTKTKRMHWLTIGRFIDFYFRAHKLI
jgi:hypothetical protein